MILTIPKVLGHKGRPDARTPHLDGMAREGLRELLKYSLVCRS